MTNFVHELQFVNGRTPAFHHSVTDHIEIKINFFSLQNPIRIHQECKSRIYTG
jgi:hypothetical protein